MGQSLSLLPVVIQDKSKPTRVAIIWLRVKTEKELNVHRSNLYITALKKRSPCILRSPDNFPKFSCLPAKSGRCTQ
ncbi:unnamed protein product, partial [Porites evermanni]